jgi:hypothetical protein
VQILQVLQAPADSDVRRQRTAGRNNLKDLIENVDKDTSKKVNDFLKKLNIATAASDAAGLAGSARTRNSNRYMLLKKKFAKKTSWADVNAAALGSSSLGQSIELTRDE